MKCKCESCQKIFNVDDKHDGKNANCPNCHNQLTIKEYIEEEIKLTPIEDIEQNKTEEEIKLTPADEPEQTKTQNEEVIILTEAKSENSQSSHQLNPWECFWYNVTKNYCNFEGRVGRREYWFFMLFAAICILCAAIIAFPWGGVLVALALALPDLGITARRFHDINRSTILAIILNIISIIPYLGLITSIIIIVFTCIQGDVNKNQYGEPPRS